MSNVFSEDFDCVKPYIVLLGDAGVGKSTIFEKVTGLTGKSSAADESFTKQTEVYESYDRSFVVCDTPGSNSLKDKFKSNLHIAKAIDFQPVSCILVIVKSHKRLEDVVDKVEKYFTHFLPEDLPFELLRVCVTHMDEVSYDKKRLLEVLKRELGLDSVITTTLDKKREDLRGDFLDICSRMKPVKIDIDEGMFLKLFDVSHRDMKIMRHVKKEVSRFKKIKADFYLKLKQPKYEDDQMDLTFEFQAWMFEEITQANKRLADENNFDYLGPQGASYAGHNAQMTNQLRLVLADVRTQAQIYHRDIDSDFRKCPHCDQVWTKIQGCDGDTYCGKRVSDEKTSDQWSNSVMYNFAFVWDTLSQKLTIIKKPREFSSSNLEMKLDDKPKLFFFPRFLKKSSKKGFGKGCGKRINWTAMKPVSYPEFKFKPLTKDVVPLNTEAMKNWKQLYESELGKLSDLQVKRVYPNGKNTDEKTPP